MDEINLSRILSELVLPDAYDHPVTNLRVVQTHTSCVFLTGKYAFKVKKPVNFEFLDYSSLELRHKFCEKEVELNRRLCPQIYLGIVPITEQSGRLRVEAAGTPLEWAVKMHQLPEAYMLSAQLENNGVSAEQMKKVAETLAIFHEKALSNDEISAFGSPERIRVNLQENFTQASRFTHWTLTSECVQNVKVYSEKFLTENQSLFLNRIKRGRIRDGHGDLRAQNICLYPHLQEGIQIFDCIEFNDRFRYEDVAADVSYLAMDLDLAARSDLRRTLLDAYNQYSKDPDLSSILPFYKCYRAFVRGKIALFASSEKEIPLDQRRKHEEIAAAAFDLANSYSKKRFPPTLFITVGISGSGKSVLSRELARRLPAVLLSSDKIRKELAAVAADSTLDASWYQPERVAMVYDELRERGRFFLQEGENVILDATFLSARERSRAAELASSCGAAFQILVCECPGLVARERIQRRKESEARFSDATISVLERQIQEYEAVNEPAIILNTESPPLALAREVLHRIQS